MVNREEALALAERGVDELLASSEQGKSERLREYLAFQARFHRYSFNNCLLIALQKPDATFVAGFQRWKELNRFVRKGEKGIMILAPLVKDGACSHTIAAGLTSSMRSRQHVTNDLSTSRSPKPRAIRPAAMGLNIGQ